MQRPNVFPANANIAYRFSSRIRTACALLLLLLLAHTEARATDVGAGKTYTTLKAAIDAVNSGALTGAVVLEITSDLTETASARLLASGVGSANYTSVLIRPKGGARTITGTFSDGNTTVTGINTKSSILFLDGADNVTVDGRIGSTGSTRSLTIANLSGTGTLSYVHAIRMANDAANNTVKYCTLKAYNGSTGNNNSGMISIATATNGNDNLTVDHCLFDGDGKGRVGLLLAGTNDDNVSVTNNEFLNNGVCAIYIYRIGNDLLVSENSVYWTSNLFGVTGAHISINVNETKNTTISNNYIGGSAAQCGGTKSALTLGSGSTIISIYHSGAVTGTLDIKGNTIGNMDITANGSGTLGAYTGISVYSVTNTTATINVQDNTIGSSTTSDDIIVRTASTAPSSSYTVYGIRNYSSQSPVNIENNKIGGILLPAPATSTVYASLYGISTVRPNTVIRNNLVGSTTVANNIRNMTGSTQASTSFFTYGIHAAMAVTGTVTIENNTVANVDMPSASSQAQMMGIYSSVISTGSGTVSNNTVRDLSTSSANELTSTFALQGIGVNFNHVVSGNKVYNLVGSHGSAAVNISGINAMNGPITMEKNYIHHLSAGAGNTSATLYGVKTATTNLYTFRNNLVHLGIAPDGSSITTGQKIRGLHFEGRHEVYNNSVYIGGTAAAADSTTTAVYSKTSFAENRYVNNVLVNNRSNTSGKGRNMIFVHEQPLDAAAIVNNNIYENKGNGFFFGRVGTTMYPVFSAWRSGIGQDAASGETDPRFVQVAGNSSAVDMRLQASNPLESRGTPVTGVTEDYAGTARNGATPDIGAYEGNYTQTNPDMQPPVVVFTDIPDITARTNYTLSNFANITDDGVIATGAQSPRLYYRKAADADTFAGNTSADEGWKYVTASNSSSPFSFNLNFSLLHDGSIDAGDVIEYFVVAQDAASHMTSLPAVAGAASYPPVESVNYSYATLLKSFAVSSTLPIRLSSFNGFAHTDHHSLQWATSFEDNNAYFEVERSADGINYTVIGKLAGAVNASVQTQYTFDDKRPLPGNNFYRLKQVDLDGRATHSKVLLLVHRLPSLVVSVSPNPVANQVTIRSANGLQRASITLKALNGQLLTQRTNVSGKVLTLDLSTYKKGAYILEVKEKSETTTIKLIKE